MAWFRRKTSEEKRQRAILKKARKRDRGNDKGIDIVPPEGVPLRFQVASLGQRFGAQLIDVLVTFLFALLLVMALWYTLRLSGQTALALATLTFFLFRIPYYIATELVWNGRTLAKKWFGLRVVSRNGRSLGVHQVAVRNLMREIEFFTPLTFLLAGPALPWFVYVATLLWVMILLIVPWRNRHNQRLGDIIAGTAVIIDPETVLLADLAGKTGRARDQLSRFVFNTSHLDQYGAFELQVLEKLLRSHDNQSVKDVSAQKQTLNDVGHRIIAKIGYPEEVPEDDMADFLRAFYREQRAYLESRKLFGDARDDKFFREDAKKSRAHENVAKQ